jgi:hypothetical protein
MTPNVETARRFAGLLWAMEDRASAFDAFRRVVRTVALSYGAEAAAQFGDAVIAELERMPTQPEAVH